MDERTFSLAEAKSLLPQLEEKLLAVKSEKEVLVRSHGEIKRASANAQAKDRKSTRLNSSHGYISYAVFCLKKKKENILRVRAELPIPSHSNRTRACHSHRHS